MLLCLAAHLLQRNDFISLPPQAVNERAQNLGVGPGRGMEQQDAAIMHPTHDFFKGGLRIRLLLLHPVVIGKAPEYAGQPQLVVIIQRPLRKSSAGEPENKYSNTMNTDEFMQKAVPLFKEQLTDIFFTFVQNDRELMKAYLDTVDSASSLGAVNRTIAKQLTKEFSLSNKHEKGDPGSNLIQSYSKLQ